MLSFRLFPFLAVGVIVRAAWAAAPAHPNVLLIVADDLNVSLGCYGHAEVHSPHIDRLAARGVRFDRAYCQYPLCNPSRVSFLSGRRPEDTGVYVLSTPARTALPHATMLPQFFRERGYFSGGAGKVFHSPKVNDAASWDFYRDEAGEDPEENAAINARYGLGDQTRPGIGGDGRPRAYRLSSDGSRTRDGITTSVITRMMREKVAEHKPFFLAAGFHKPHLPWTAPAEFFALYPFENWPLRPEGVLAGVPPIALQTELSGFAQPDSRVEAVRGYYACVSFVDANVGRLLDELDRLSLWDSTIVVLLGDNGFHLGDHGGLWSKLSAFDASTRVPLIIAGAGVPKGAVVTSPVELLDLYPTLVALTGFAPPEGLQGISLADAMHGGVAVRPSPVSTLVYHFDLRRGADVPGRSVITSAWRYTEWDGGAAGRELYSHVDDPDEYRNLIDDERYADAVQFGVAAIRRAPAPKTGPANRPRALLAEPQAFP